MKDIRDILFAGILDKPFKAQLTVEKDGCISGVDQAKEAVAQIGGNVTFFLKEGDTFKMGDVIAEVVAKPKEIAAIEEKLMGTLAKYSGIATAAKRAVECARGRADVISGSWKKMPPEIKDGVRKAVESGGASYRITQPPMIYMDKNYIRMLGSVKVALEAAAPLEGHKRIVQIRGEIDSVETETREAAAHGCNIFMVDTGAIEDLKKCVDTLKELGVRDSVSLAYSGNVRHEDIDMLCDVYGVNMLCIGKAIIDAQLIDMKLDVV